MAATKGVGAWLQGHPHLRAAEVKSGEVAAALLILWEVDHGRQWPSQAQADDWHARAKSFGAALCRGIRSNKSVAAWLCRGRCHGPLVPGMKPSAYMRYSVDINEAVGADFLGRWKSYLEDVRRQQVLQARGAGRRQVGRPGGSVVVSQEGGEVASGVPVRTGRKRACDDENNQPEEDAAAAPEVREVSVVALRPSRATRKRRLEAVTRGGAVVAETLGRQREEPTAEVSSGSLGVSAPEVVERRRRSQAKSRGNIAGRTEPTQSPQSHCRNAMKVGTGKRGREAAEENVDLESCSRRQKRRVSRHGRATESVT